MSTSGAKRCRYMDIVEEDEKQGELSHGFPNVHDVKNLSFMAGYDTDYNNSYEFGSKFARMESGLLQPLQSPSHAPKLEEMVQMQASEGNAYLPRVSSDSNLSDGFSTGVAQNLMHLMLSPNTKQEDEFRSGGAFPVSSENQTYTFPSKAPAHPALLISPQPPGDFSMLSQPLQTFPLNGTVSSFPTEALQCWGISLKVMQIDLRAGETSIHSLSSHSAATLGTPATNRILSVEYVLGVCIYDLTTEYVLHVGVYPFSRDLLFSLCALPSQFPLRATLPYHPSWTRSPYSTNPGRTVPPNSSFNPTADPDSSMMDMADDEASPHAHSHSHSLSYSHSHTPRRSRSPSPTLPLSLSELCISSPASASTELLSRPLFSQKNVSWEPLPQTPSPQPHAASAVHNTLSSPGALSPPPFHSTVSTYDPSSTSSSPDSLHMDFPRWLEHPAQSHVRSAIHAGLCHAYQHLHSTILTPELSRRSFQSSGGGSGGHTSNYSYGTTHGEGSLPPLLASWQSYLVQTPSFAALLRSHSNHPPGDGLERGAPGIPTYDASTHAMDTTPTAPYMPPTPALPLPPVPAVGVVVGDTQGIRDLWKRVLQGLWGTGVRPFVEEYFSATTSTNTTVSSSGTRFMSVPNMGASPSITYETPFVPSFGFPSPNASTPFAPSLAAPMHPHSLAASLSAPPHVAPPLPAPVLRLCATLYRLYLSQSRSTNTRQTHPIPRDVDPAVPVSMGSGSDDTEMHSLECTPTPTPRSMGAPGVLDGDGLALDRRTTVVARLLPYLDPIPPPLYQGCLLFPFMPLFAPREPDETESLDDLGALSMLEMAHAMASDLTPANTTGAFPAPYGTSNASAITSAEVATRPLLHIPKGAGASSFLEPYATATDGIVGDTTQVPADAATAAPVITAPHRSLFHRHNPSWGPPIHLYPHPLHPFSFCFLLAPDTPVTYNIFPKQLQQVQSAFNVKARVPLLHTATANASANPLPAYSPSPTPSPMPSPMPSPIPGSIEGFDEATIPTFQGDRGFVAGDVKMQWCVGTRVGALSVTPSLGTIAGAQRQLSATSSPSSRLRVLLQRL